MVDFKSAKLRLSPLLDKIVEAAKRAIGLTYYAAVKIRWSLPGLHKVIPFDARIMLHHSVIVGKDGFLFHRDGDAIEQIDGRITYSPDELRHWISTLRARNAWCESRAILSRTLIIPEKHIVYEDKLPSQVKIAKMRPAAQLLAAVNSASEGEILYPVDALKKARAQRETFYKTDTHWTNFGAFVAFKELISNAPICKQIDETDLAWIEQNLTGDLGVRFDPERSESALMMQFTAPPCYRLVYQNQYFARGAVHIYQNDRTDLPRCVMFRDSFANSLIPYLMRSFSRLVAVSSLSWHYDLLESERPDLVIFAVIERFLASYGTGSSVELPKDEGGPSFADFCGIDLPFVAAMR